MITVSIDQTRGILMAIADLPRTRLHAADLWRLSHQPEYANQRLELDRGELITMTPAGILHGSTANTLSSRIDRYVRPNKLGIVTAAETGYILHSDPERGDIVRAPDVGFIAAGRFPDGQLPDGYAPFAPNLAIEVVSPSNDAESMQAKVTEYLTYGTQRVIVVYPRVRQVTMHTREGSRTLTENDVMDGGDVLPGFSMIVREIFEID